MATNKAHFKAIKVTDLYDVKEGDIIPTSDLLLSSDTKAVQFELIDPNADSDSRVIIEPGTYTLYDAGYGEIKHKPMELNNDRVESKYASLEQIVNIANKFFSKLDIYNKRGMFPKRAALLWGPPGNGKTTSLLSAISKFKTQNTVTIFWPTAVLRAHHVKEFLNNVNFKNIERFIMVVEDIGGGERTYTGDKMPVDSELLAMLDNSTGTFTIPSMIFATTNYPGNLIEPLLRTGRFDDIIEVKAPTGEQRKELLEFFSGTELLNVHEDNRTALEEIAKSKYDSFSISDLKELPLKSELEDITLLQAINLVHNRIKNIKVDFQKEKESLGF
jgi:SpoVK/Ycf46/Vps4 family AAA+-type ATPase